MDIRPAVLEDVPVIGRMCEDFFTHNASQQPVYYRKAPAVFDYPKQVVESASADFLVAVSDGMVVGFLHVTQGKTPSFPCFVPQTYAAIDDLYVAPPFRRKGIATALVNAAKRWAQARQLDYMELNVLSENTDAITFYQAAGFTPVSHIMRCRLEKENV